MNLPARNSLDRQLQQTVVQEETVTGLYDSRQVLEAHGHALLSANGFLYGQYELLAGMQLNRLWFDRADPDLWPWEVGHDRHTAANGLRCRADALDALRMTGEIAVREVKPRDV